MMRPPRTRNGFSLIEVLVVFAIISVLISLIIPVIVDSREAAHRAQCENDLKQVLLSIHNYSSTHDQFPSGVINAKGPIENIEEGQHLSWIAQLLPYIEQRALSDSLDDTKSIYSWENSSVRGAVINSLLCPSDGGPQRGLKGQGISNYAAVQNDVEAPIDGNNNGTFFLNSNLRYESLLDGSSQTIFVGEKLRNEADLGWLSGTRSTLRNAGMPLNSGDLLYATGPIATWSAEGRTRNGTPIAADPKSVSAVGGFASRHQGGANFGFGDGSVRFLSENVQRDVFQRLANRADGELINDADY